MVRENGEQLARQGDSKADLSSGVAKEGGSGSPLPGESCLSERQGVLGSLLAFGDIIISNRDCLSPTYRSFDWGFLSPFRLWKLGQSAPEFT